SPAAEVVDGPPGQSPSDQDGDERQPGEDRHRPAGDVLVLQEEGRPGDEQDQEGDALERGPQVLPEPAEAVDLVVLGQPEGDGGQGTRSPPGRPGRTPPSPPTRGRSPGGGRPPAAAPAGRVARRISTSGRRPGGRAGGSAPGPRRRPGAGFRARAGRRRRASR